MGISNVYTKNISIIDIIHELKSNFILLDSFLILLKEKVEIFVEVYIYTCI